MAVEAALYDPEHGFYATQGRAGRRGDFITSPEIGPLFGAVVARALDRWWDELGRPDPYVVIEAGAGAGTLARSVAGAAPRCLPALRYHPVDRGDALPADRPAVVLANELLDNLPFDLAEARGGAWREVLVDVDTEGRLTEGVGPVAVVGEEPAVVAATDGARIPVQRAAADWLRAMLDRMPDRLLVIDYADTTASMATRPWTDWVRTYRGHQRGDHPLADLGAQDITVEVALDQLAAVRPPDRAMSQAEFLTEHGIAELVDEGRRIWAERAHIGDLAALRARSRIAEAEALTDPGGLGGFTVIEWTSVAPPADA
ncbi:MAG: SAM-dependent methyltransferase [Acidimicrobiales bacterium]